MDGNNVKNSRDRWGANTKLVQVAIVVFVVLTGQTGVFAAKWEFTPTLTFTQLYSDNINLDPSGEEESCFLTRINPGISIRPRQEGGRVQVDFNTRIQSPIGFGCNQAENSFFIQHQSNLIAEIIKNSVFLESRSSISQQNRTNTGRITTDSISDSGNRTRVQTFSISPYWRPHLGGYVEGETRLRYNTVSTSSGDASDTSSHAETINLNSGSQFTLLTWNLNVNNRESIRDGGDNVTFTSYNGGVQYQLPRNFNVFGRVSGSNNDFESTTNSNRNATVNSIGAGWTPSPKVSFEAGMSSDNINDTTFFVGATWRPTRHFFIQSRLNRTDSFVTINVNPSTRTSLEATYTNRDFGTNTGDTLRLSFRHRGRRTTWTAQYFEDTTTTQQLLLESGFQYFNSNGDLQSARFSEVPGFGEEDLNLGIVQIVPLGDDLVVPLNRIDLPTFTDEVFIRKRGQVSVAITGAKSTIFLTAFDERRIFQEDGDEEEVYGWNTSWNWRFGRQISSNMSLSWQTTDNRVDDNDDEFTQFSFSINRTLSRYFTGNIQYRFQKQESDRPEDEYDENRITASLTYTF